MAKYKWIKCEGDNRVGVFNRQCNCKGVPGQRVTEFTIDEDNRVVVPSCRKCGQDYMFSELKMKVAR